LFGEKADRAIDLIEEFATPAVAWRRAQKANRFARLPASDIGSAIKAISANSRLRPGLLSLPPAFRQG
jgi:hypothetical protein